VFWVRDSPMKKKLNLDLKKGYLHRALKIPEGKPIPIDLEKKAASQNKNKRLKKAAQLALNMRKWK
jgi:hypothetical protein